MNSFFEKNNNCTISCYWNFSKPIVARIVFVTLPAVKVRCIAISVYVCLFVHRRNIRVNRSSDPHFLNWGTDPHFIGTPRAWSPTFQTKVTPLYWSLCMSACISRKSHIPISPLFLAIFCLWP